MNNNFHGYTINSTNIAKVESILQQAKANMKQAAIELYHKYLSEEITSLVDDIALNVLARPQCSILEAANNRLFQRIQNAEANNFPTEYNLKVMLQILNYKGKTYIVYCGKSSYIEDAFASTDGIIKSNTEPTPEGEESADSKKWNRILKDQDGDPVLYSHMAFNLELDKTLLVFGSVKDRAEERARHELTSHYLNMLAGGQQIAPNELMRLMDKALAMVLEAEDSELLLNEKQMQLMKILPVITLELIDGVPDENK